MLKKIMLPAFAGLILGPAIASGASVKELEERIVALEDEALVATEGIYDINSRTEDWMTMSGYTIVLRVIDHVVIPNVHQIIVPAISGHN